MDKSLKNTIKKYENKIYKMPIFYSKLEYVLCKYTETYGTPSDELWLKIKSLKKRISKISVLMIMLDNSKELKNTEEIINDLYSEYEHAEYKRIIKFLKKYKGDVNEIMNCHVDLLNINEEETGILNRFDAFENEFLPEIHSNNDLVNYKKQKDDCNHLQFKFILSLLTLMSIIMKLYKFEVVIKNESSKNVYYYMDEFSKIEDHYKLLWEKGETLCQTM